MALLKKEHTFWKLARILPLKPFHENKSVKWAFVLSCVAMSAGSMLPAATSRIGIFCAFGIASYLTFKKQLLENVFSQEQGTLISRYAAFVLTLLAIEFQSSAFVQKILALYPNGVPYILNQLSIPSDFHHTFLSISIYLLYCSTAFAFFFFLYVFIIRFSAFMTDLWKTSDRSERCFFLLTLTIAAIAISVIYLQTNCFYAPLKNGKIIPFDVVYTSDSGEYYESNVYGSISASENDFRQPLFALFAMPFAGIAKISSKIFFFFPGSYVIILGMIQVGLLCVSIIIMSRLMQLTTTTKSCFFMAFVLTYPFLLFSLMYEQYIFAVFWLFIFLHTVFHEKENQDYAFVAATGSLITSAAVLPLLYWRKEIRPLIFRCFDYGSKYLVFFVLTFHQEHAPLNLMRFAGGKIQFGDRLNQFIHFIASCFYKQDTVITQSPLLSYQLTPVESLNVPGLVLLAFCLLGFMLNYKDRFAQICSFWIALSFFILCLIGWGTAENGLILYSLYFGWAYFSLVFLAIEKIFIKLLFVKNIIFITIIVVLAYINIPGIFDLIQFGIKYYPTN
jgi:hypothetical protein